MWNIFFSQNYVIYYLFFYFLLFLTFYFQFRLSVLVKKMLEIFMFFYFMDYRFCHRILENSWIFIKKIQNIFIISSFTIFFFNFLLFLTFFFFLFYQSMVFKKIVKLLCCFIVWIRDFIKKLRYLKSKISTKFHRLLFLFLFI